MFENNGWSCLIRENTQNKCNNIAPETLLTQLLTCGRICVRRKPSLSLSAPTRPERKRWKWEGEERVERKKRVKSEIRTETISK